MILIDFRVLRTFPNFREFPATGPDPEKVRGNNDAAGPGLAKTMKIRGGQKNRK